MQAVRRARPASARSIRRRRSQRSASAPMGRPSRKSGSVCRAPTRPIARPDPVRPKTSRGTAVKLTASPRADAPWPLRTTRKSRLARSGGSMVSAGSGHRRTVAETRLSHWPHERRPRAGAGGRPARSGRSADGRVPRPRSGACRSTDERALFERLSLECFQAGLSWSLILHRREGFRDAFRGFDPARRGRLRRGRRGPPHGRPAASCATGPRSRPPSATRGRSPASGRRAAPWRPSWRPMGSGRRARLPASAVGGRRAGDDRRLRRAVGRLRARGFRFVGSTVVYAFMQSVGLVDDHLPTCFRYGASAVVVPS